MLLRSHLKLIYLSVGIKEIVKRTAWRYNTFGQNNNINNNSNNNRHPCTTSSISGSGNYINLLKESWVSKLSCAF